jgi:hypothetical protein
VDRSAAAGAAEARVERHLTILMGSRLALSIASLVIAVGLDHIGGNITVTEWQGFYGAVVLAFVATLVYRPFAGRVERIRPFVVANIVLDLCLVSALVLFSGGSESVFTFLYVVVPAYAAVLLSGRGVLACAALAGAAYAGVLLGERGGLLGRCAGWSTPPRSPWWRCSRAFWWASSSGRGRPSISALPIWPSCARCTSARSRV